MLAPNDATLDFSNFGRGSAELGQSMELKRAEYSVENSPVRRQQIYMTEKARHCEFSAICIIHNFKRLGRVWQYMVREVRMF